jgi:hypothetical protein
MLSAAFRCLLAVAFLSVATAASYACSTIDRRAVLRPGLLIMSAGRERPSGADRFDPCILQLAPGAPERQPPLLVASTTTAMALEPAVFEPPLIRTFVVWLSDRLATRRPPDS